MRRAVDEDDTMRIELGELLKGGVDLRVRGRRAPGADRDGQGVLERRSQVGVASRPRAGDAVGRARQRLRSPPGAAAARRGRPASWAAATSKFWVSPCSAFVLVMATVISRSLFLDRGGAQAARLWNSAYPVFFQFECQLLATGFLDLARGHHVHTVGYDVVFSNR